MQDSHFLDPDRSEPGIPRPDYISEEVENREKLKGFQVKREELEQELEAASRDLESLRQQRESLRNRHQSLEILKQRGEQFREEKADLLDRLEVTLSLLEQEEAKVAEAHEVLTASRTRCRLLTERVRGFQDPGGSDEVQAQDLERIFGKLGDARMDFRKVLARLDAMDATGDFLNSGAPEPTRSFAQWFFMGVAIAIPLSLAVFVSLMAVWILTKAFAGE